LYNAIKNDEQDYVVKMVLQTTRAMKEGDTIRSLETGLANGGSALAILATAMESNYPIRHTAFDPYQESEWKNEGLGKVREILGMDAERAKNVDFTHSAKPAAIGLAEMEDHGECVHFAFLDDGHRFDDNLVELYFVNKMLVAGGVMIFDDFHMPSVKATVNFIENNLPYKRLKSPARFAAYVKTGPDHRKWDHYGSFTARFEAKDKKR
jgi:cephalosporin hydroxylase